MTNQAGKSIDTVDEKGLFNCSCGANHRRGPIAPDSVFYRCLACGNYGQPERVESRPAIRKAVTKLFEDTTPSGTTNQEIIDEVVKFANDLLDHEEATRIGFLDQLRDLNRARQQEVFPECNHWGPVDSANEVQGEVGEVCEITEAMLLLALSNSLAKSAGKLGNVVKKMKRDLPGLISPAARGYDSQDQFLAEGITYLEKYGKLREALKREVADVMITLDMLAERAAIDIAEVTKLKFNEVSKKRNSTVFFK